MTKSTDTAKGWYPQADRIAVPMSNYAEGNRGRAAVCIHISEGSYTSVVQEFTAAKQKSSHLLIGENGVIGQFVSFVDTAYTAGLSWSETRKVWIDPEKYELRPPYKPTWELLEPPVNPNWRLLNIELAGYHDKPRPQAQLDALVQALRYIAGVFTSVAPYAVGRTLIGHYHISPRNRPNCPGPHVDLAALAVLANGPKPKQTYRLKAPMWISETPTPFGPIALNGRAVLREGELIDVDEVKNGQAHLANGVGFLPIGGLELVG